MKVDVSRGSASGVRLWSATIRRSLCYMRFVVSWLPQVVSPRFAERVSNRGAFWYNKATSGRRTPKTPEPRFPKQKGSRYKNLLPRLCLYFVLTYFFAEWDARLLPPKLNTVSLTLRFPNRIASRLLAVQISIRRPRTIPPVSATKYSPLQSPASSLTRDPNGNTRGSAAMMPLLTGFPLAVRPFKLYAVAKYNVGGTSISSLSIAGFMLLARASSEGASDDAATVTFGLTWISF